jgi:thiosulfate/3-mercaptopyruvate sulfurtransferase
MRYLDRTLQIVVACGLAMLAGCTEAPSTQEKPAEPQPAMDSLVSAAWLKEHLGDPDLVVLDTTVVIESDASGNFQSINGRASYEEGHIPGAGFADLMGDLSDPDAEYQYTLPSPAAFAAAMGALGVGDDTRVVLYDRMGLPWAARVWWMLRWIGFDNAALLDGGLNAWTAAGGELSTGPVAPTPRTLSVNLRPGLIADQAEVRAAIDDESVRLVDVLPEIHYRGEWTMYEQPGHIPGAINVPTDRMFDETGRFRPDEELATLLGDDRDTRTITYCGGGIAASIDAFVFTRLGFSDVAVYDGSLDEWTSDPENPMEIDLDSFGETGE